MSTRLRSAASSIAGSFFPRFSARRRIPAHAFGLKEYRSGTARLGSSTSDNEHALPSLGQSEVLSVQHPVGEPIPEFCQRPEEGSQRPSSVRRQDTGDVFPDHPARAKYADQSAEVQREGATVAFDSGAEAGDGEVLAGGSSDEYVDGVSVNSVSWVEELGEVAMVGHSGEAVGEQGGREGVDLAEPRGLPAQWFPCDRGGLDSRADRSVPEWLHFFLFPNA